MATLYLNMIVLTSHIQNDEKYYYARRGCTQNPEDGLASSGITINPDMTKDPDAFIFEGLTSVDIYLQRASVTLGNNYATYKFDPAIPMECFSCKGETTIRTNEKSGKA